MNEMQSPCLALKHTSGIHLDVNSYPFHQLLHDRIPIHMQILQWHLSSCSGNAESASIKGTRLITVAIMVFISLHRAKLW